MAIRSGRFEATIKKTDSPIVIVDIGRDAYYRIFNSSDKLDNGGVPFKVLHGSGQESIVKPTYTLDVVVTADLQITTDSATDVEVVGMYDFLDTQSEIRSGRFRLRTADSPQSKHKIISTQGGNVAYYRIFNSGDESFKIWEDNSSLKDELKGGQSFDFEASRNRDYFVSALANVEIAGIYDFLGM